MNKFKIWDEYIDPLIKKWLFAPFSNKLTRLIAYLGGVCISAPLLEFLIIKQLLNKYLGINVELNVPETTAYIAGVILIAIAAIHNMYIRRLELVHGASEKIERNTHDLKIIHEILKLLPYENTVYQIERSSYAGLPREILNNIESCEKFITPPYLMFNKNVEAEKCKLISSINKFVSKTFGYLGAQEDKTGKLYLPPYHWKIPGTESEKKYYEMLYALKDAGVELESSLNSFILCVKNEGFVVSEI